MKSSRYPRHHASAGSVLLVVMGTVVVIGIALAAVLSLATHEQRILARTTAWNIALPAAEAGIEEAMSHLRHVKSGSRAVNGWRADGSSFVLSRTNSPDSRYTVGIDAATPPHILSVGEVWCPSAGRYIKRTVLVTTSGRGRFNTGLVAKQNINLRGQFSSDSFDSQKPELSTNGQYDPAKRSDNGDVGSVNGVIDIGGQVKIYGSVATGPTATVNVDSQGSVGTKAWVDAGTLGIQADHHIKDLNVSFPIATAPYTNSGATPQPGIVGGVGIPPLVVGGTTYKYILEDGVDYRLSTLVLSSTDKMLVRGKARLVVDQDVSLTGQSSIQIEANGSLELYVKQSSISIAGSAVVNKSGTAANFSLFGLPGVKDVSMTGNGMFLGTIYAPQATLKLSGGGNDILDFMGAGIFNDVTGSGHFRFHYDESLGYESMANLVIASWKEI